MSHPDRGTWMDYIYGEAEAPERRRLKEHLETCEPCSEQVAAWRRTMDLLDECAEPARAAAPRPIRLGAVARWAMAAAILVLVGYVAGRVSAPGKEDTAALRADIAAARREVRDEVLAQLRQEMDDKALATLAACRSLTEERLAELVASFDATRRSDMLALATVTERELLRTQQQIAALAYEQTARAGEGESQEPGTLTEGG